jgi:hypothetical protein
MEVSGQLQSPAAVLPGKAHPVPIIEEAGWAPAPVFTLWRREKFLPLAGNRISAVQPVTISTELYRRQKVNFDMS